VATTSTPGHPAKPGSGAGRTAAAADSGGGTATAPTAPDRAAQNAAKKRERELARLEAEIADRETRQRQLEEQLADPELYHDAARSQGIVVEYERVRSELESLWQRLAQLG
jgi:ATP-binding cassette subfamily F protein 3